SPYNPLSIVYNNPVPSLIGGVIGTQIFNNAGQATDVVTDTVRTGGITAGIVTAIQFGYDSVLWFKGNINSKELGRRIVRNTTVNGSSVVGGAGGSAVGGAIGTGKSKKFFFFFEKHCLFFHIKNLKKRFSN